MNLKWYEGWPEASSVLEVEEGDILEFSIQLENRTSRPVVFRAEVGGDLKAASVVEPSSLPVSPGLYGRLVVRITPKPGIHEAVLEVFRGASHHEGGEPKSITIKCKGNPAAPQPEPVPTPEPVAATTPEPVVPTVPVVPAVPSEPAAPPAPAAVVVPEPPQAAEIKPEPVPEPAPLTPKPDPIQAPAVVPPAAPLTPSEIPPQTVEAPAVAPVTPPAQPKPTPAPEPPPPSAPVGMSSAPPPAAPVTPAPVPPKPVEPQAAPVSTPIQPKPTPAPQPPQPAGPIGMSSAPRPAAPVNKPAEPAAKQSESVSIGSFDTEQETIRKKAEAERTAREGQRQRPELYETDVTLEDPPRDGGILTMRPGQKAKVLLPVKFDIEEAASTSSYREFNLTVTNPLDEFGQQAVNIVWGAERVPAGGTALLFFLLEVPHNTPQGRYDFVISLTAGQRSSEDRQMLLEVEPVPAVQIQAEKTEVLQRFLPPKTCAFKLTVHNHSLGNTPTAYRLAVKRPEDNVAAKLPYDDADLYETPDWEIVFDDELNDIRRADNSSQLVGNNHLLTVKRKGIWWFGFKEQLPLKVEAAPVTDVKNSGVPGGTIDLMLTRQRLIPMSSWLAIPLLSALLFLLFVMAASSHPSLVVTNGLKVGDVYYVFADQLATKQNQTIPAKLQISDSGPFKPKVERSVDGQVSPISGKDLDDFVLTSDEYHKSVDYIVRPLFGAEVKQKVVFMGYRTSNLFSFEPPGGGVYENGPPMDLEIGSDDEPVVTVDDATGLTIEHWKLDLSLLKKTGQNEYVIRFYNLAKRPNEFKVVLAYSEGNRFLMRQGATGDLNIMEMPHESQIAGKQLIIKDLDPGSTKSEVMWLMTSDAKTEDGAPMSAEPGIRIYKITVSNGGQE